MELVSSGSLAWRESAACKGIDPNVFVPHEKSGLTGRSTYAVARTFCAQCTVVEECLMFAVENNIEFGMFGGTTPRDRRVVKRQVRLSTVQ